MDERTTWVIKDYNGEVRVISLTKEQMRLLEWLKEEDYIDPDMLIEPTSNTKIIKI